MLREFGTLRLVIFVVFEIKRLVLLRVNEEDGFDNRLDGEAGVSEHSNEIPKDVMLLGGSVGIWLALLGTWLILLIERGCLDRVVDCVSWGMMDCLDLFTVEEGAGIWLARLDRLECEDEREQEANFDVFSGVLLNNPYCSCLRRTVLWVIGSVVRDSTEASVDWLSKEEVDVDSVGHAGRWCW